MKDLFLPNSFIPISFLPTKPSLHRVLPRRSVNAAPTFCKLFGATLAAIALATTPIDALAASSTVTTQAELNVYCHEYVLNDGRVLNVYKRGQRYFATFDHHPGHEIFAVAPAVFDIPTKYLRLSFTQYANGIVTGVSLTPTMSMASNTAAPK